MNREETLNSYLNPTWMRSGDSGKAIHKAMSSYARERSIAFAEWCSSNYTVVKGKWVDLDLGVLSHGSQEYYQTLSDTHGKTSEALYNLFTELNPEK